MRLFYKILFLFIVTTVLNSSVSFTQDVVSSEAKAARIKLKGIYIYQFARRVYWPTLWHKVSKVDFAYGQSIDVSAIKFIHSGNKRWNTMWGECQLFTNPNFNNRYCYLFGMVEQPSFIIGVPFADSSFLKEDIKELEKIWNEVGTKKENF